MNETAVSGRGWAVRTWKMVACPTCNQPKGRSCRTVSGTYRVTDTHIARMNAYHEWSVGRASDDTRKLTTGALSVLIAAHWKHTLKPDNYVANMAGLTGGIFTDEEIRDIARRERLLT